VLGLAFSANRIDRCIGKARAGVVAGTEFLTESGFEHEDRKRMGKTAESALVTGAKTRLASRRRRVRDRGRYLSIITSIDILNCCIS